MLCRVVLCVCCAVSCYVVVCDVRFVIRVVLRHVMWCCVLLCCVCVVALCVVLSLVALVCVVFACCCVIGV